MNSQKELHNEYQLISCDECQVTGTQASHKCSICKGSQLGLWLDSFYFYWKGDITNHGREKRVLHAHIRKIVTLLFVVIAILSLGMWGLSLYTYISAYGILADQIIEQSALSYVWFAVLIGFYLIYRFIFFRERDVKVLKKTYKAKKNLSPHFEDAQHSQRIEISRAFDTTAQEALYNAWELAARLQHREVTPVHLLAVLPQFNQVAVVLSRLGLTGANLQNKFTNILAAYPMGEIGADPKIAKATHKVILYAYLYAYQEHLEKVSVVDLLNSLTLSEYEQEHLDAIQDIFEDLEITQDTLKNVIQWMRIKQHLYERYKRFHSLARFKPKGDVNRAMTSIATKTLDMFSQDLTRMAAYEQLMPCIGRQKEIEEIFRIIEGTNKSILLVGNKGIGRGTIIEGIAQLMVTEDVPEILQDKRMVDVSLPHLIGGVQPAGAQERLLHALDEAIVSGNIILSIRNIELMVGITTGGATSLDLSQVLVNSLKNRRLFAIATTDPQTYSRYIENTGISEAFNVVRIKEMDDNEAIQVLESKVGYLEAQHNVYFSYDALEKAVKLAQRYMHDKYLPEKSIDVIEEVAVYVRNNKSDSKLVLGEDVAHIISNRTNIPVTSLDQNETEKLLNLEALIHERIIGQEEAVRVVAAGLRRARTQLRDGKRPIANLLFLGPTGVGKTEVSKTLADIYFGSEDNMIRFDMSEYQEKSSIDRLIGTIDNPGHLTDSVRRKPFSLLLFDELEKAHPDILNIFLQMMDDGRLTDGMGHTVDFTNTIIIATSNAGTQYIQQEIEKGTSTEVIREHLMREELKSYYRPEFLNRYDNIVVFTPLTFEDILKITKLSLAKIQNRLDQQGIIFEYTEEALQELAQAGYDPQFGARPLRRALQERVDNVLADHLLAGKIKRRDTVIYHKGGQLEIKAKS